MIGRDRLKKYIDVAIVGGFVFTLSVMLTVLFIATGKFTIVCS